MTTRARTPEKLKRQTGGRKPAAGRRRNVPDPGQAFAPAPPEPGQPLDRLVSFVERYMIRDPSAPAGPGNLIVWWERVG